MGYLVKQNIFKTYQFTFDSSVVQTCGSSPLYLMDTSPNGYGSNVFIPISATLRNVNQTTAYNFGGTSHCTIQDSPVIYFIWKILLNAMPTDIYSFTSLYTQAQHNYGGGTDLIGNAVNSKSQNSLYLTTYDGNDSTTGNGQLRITISGFNAII